MSDNKEKMNEEEQNEESCDIVFDDHRVDRWLDQFIEQDAKEFWEEVSKSKSDQQK